VGSAIARKWLDVEGVEAIVDVPNSEVGLTTNSLRRDTRMTFRASSTERSELTGEALSLIDIADPTRLLRVTYAGFGLKKKSFMQKRINEVIKLGFGKSIIT